MNTVRPSKHVMLSVWKALFLREALTRLSVGRAAWLWLLLEPVFHLTFLMVLVFTVRQRHLPGVEFAQFLAIGILSFQMFKHSARRSMDAIPANAALFSYRQIKPVDTVLIRAMLEGLLQLVISVILLSGMNLIGIPIVPHDLLGVIIALTLLWLLGTSLGLVLSVSSALIPEIGKVARLIFMPLYFMSGVMFAPFMMPPRLQELFLLNPIMHGIELTRAAFFSGYQLAAGVDMLYLLNFILGLMFLGLALHVRFATRLVAR